MACDPFMLRQATIHASLLVRSAGFSANERDDLRQELLLDLLRRSPRFNPRRGEWRGFVRGVVRNHATVLATRRHRLNQREVLADDLFGGDQDAFEGLRRHDPVDDLHLRLDVARVLAGLPAQLRQLAHLLTVLSMSEVPMAIGKSRSGVYQMLRKIRMAFSEAGFGAGPTVRR